MVVAHVAERIDGDAAAHDANDERHDHGQAVDVERVRDRNVFSDVDLEPDGEKCLDQREDGYQPPTVPHRLGHDIEAQEHVDCQSRDVEQVRRLGI